MRILRVNKYSSSPEVKIEEHGLVARQKPQTKSTSKPLESAQFELSLESPIANSVSVGSAVQKAGVQLGSSVHIDSQEIYNRAVFLLSRREHSVKELSSKLARKFPNSDGTDLAMARLIEQGLVCDERFTEAFVRHRQLQGYGPVRIRAELKQKGVALSLAEEFVDQHAGHWRQTARSQHQKKFAGKPVLNFREWARRARFLQGRGFTQEQIEYAVPDINPGFEQDV